jgi:hypothetical protein
VRRKHSDVLIAGLILVGATMWISYLIHAVVSIDEITRIAVWFASAFVATQITRRALVDLETGVTTIAAIVATTIVGGFVMERRHEPLQIGILGPIIGAAIGAVLSALTSRRPRRTVRLGWRLAAAGFGSLGMMLVLVAIAELALDSEGALGGATLAGATLGSFIVALCIDVEGWMCAVSVALLVSAFLFRAGADELGAQIGATVLLAMLAAIGGAIGSRIRAARQRNVELPEAQVR